jgi:hypothetical protein
MISPGCTRSPRPSCDCLDRAAPPWCTAGPSLGAGTRRGRRREALHRRRGFQRFDVRRPGDRRGLWTVAPDCHPRTRWQERCDRARPCGSGVARPWVVLGEPAEQWSDLLPEHSHPRSANALRRGRRGGRRARRVDGGGRSYRPRHARGFVGVSAAARTGRGVHRRGSRGGGPRAGLAVGGPSTSTGVGSLSRPCSPIWSLGRGRRGKRCSARCSRRVEAGSVGVNFYNLDLGSPFGGVKASGLGRELGPESPSAYVSYKSIYTRG